MSATALIGYNIGFSEKSFYEDASGAKRVDFRGFFFANFLYFLFAPLRLCVFSGEPILPTQAPQAPEGLGCIHGSGLVGTGVGGGPPGVDVGAGVEVDAGGVHAQLAPLGPEQ